MIKRDMIQLDSLPHCLPFFYVDRCILFKRITFSKLTFLFLIIVGFISLNEERYLLGIDEEFRLIREYQTFKLCIRETCHSDSVVSW